jgi:hypothetical protein
LTYLLRVRHLVAYLLFVGVPFTGLMGVLRLGQGLRAPQAVHGIYAVSLGESAATCPAVLLSGDSSLTLAQSGRQITATLGRAGAVTLRGTVSDSVLSLTGVVPRGAAPSSAGCPAGDTLRLTGLARRTQGPGRIDGTLRFTRCADCPPAAFGAVRLPPPRGRGA